MKYKLNETVKKQIREQGYPNNIDLEAEIDEYDWKNVGFDLGHLVEVRERIGVMAYSMLSYPSDGHGFFLLCKPDKSVWSTEEIQKVESALNGEVLTLGQMREYFEQWSEDDADYRSFYNFLYSKFK